VQGRLVLLPGAVTELAVPLDSVIHVDNQERFLAVTVITGLSLIGSAGLQ